MAQLTTANPADGVPYDSRTVEAVGLAILADRLSFRGAPFLIPVQRLLPAGVSAADLLRGLSLDGEITLIGADAGLDLFTDGPSEGDGDATDTDIQTISASISTGLVRIARSVTDEARSRSLLELVRDPVRLAIETSAGYGLTITQRCCELAATASEVVGTSGVAMDHDLFMDACDSRPSGDYSAQTMVLHTKQFQAWKRDLESRPGVTQWRPATAQMQAVLGSSYAGVYDNVQIWVCDRVTEDGGDYTGFIAGASSVVLREDAHPPPVPGQNILFDIGADGIGSILRGAIERDEDARTSRMFVTARFGVAFAGNESRVRRILSTGL